jgi:hypothetical protein
MHLLEPTRLHDACDPDSIVAVALVDLHLEHRLGMTRIARQAKSLELGPQPRRPRLEANPYCTRRL